MRGYDDFSIEWDGICKQNKIAQMQSQGAISQTLQADIAGISIDTTAQLKSVFSLGAHPNQQRQGDDDDPQDSPGGGGEEVVENGR